MSTLSPFVGTGQSVTTIQGMTKNENILTPDFFLDNGVIIEAKGRWSAADRRKMLAMKEQYPDEPIYMLFMRDNKLSKTANQTYTAWCESNGITCAVGMPPEEWLHGQARDTKQVESIAEKESANTTAAKRSGSGT